MIVKVISLDFTPWQKFHYYTPTTLVDNLQITFPFDYYYCATKECGFQMAISHSALHALKNSYLTLGVPLNLPFFPLKKIDFAETDRK